MIFFYVVKKFIFINSFTIKKNDNRIIKTIERVLRKKLRFSIKKRNYVLNAFSESF